MEYVVLVDSNDQEIGSMEKMRAHVEGKLHRAISVFVFNSRGELLLQKRAMGKYHSEGLWTNTCCSHPRVGEAVLDAANRRLGEEMGMSCPLVPVYSFVYHAGFANHLIEHEYDHVFAGFTDVHPKPDATEVAAWKYMGVAKILADIEQHPDNYTEWFKMCLKDVAAAVNGLSINK